MKQGSTKYLCNMWKVILLFLYSIFIIASLGIYFFYRNASIQGVNTIHLAQTPAIQQILIEYLKSYQGSHPLKMNYYYMKHSLIENQPIQKLNADITCQGNDPFLLSYRLIQWIGKNNLTVLESQEKNQKIQLSVGFERTEIIQLTIKK